MYFRDRLQLIFYLTYTCIIYVSDKRDTAHCLFDCFFFFGNAWKPSGDYFGVGDAIN